MPADIKSKIRGALVGTLVGDVMGRPFENFPPTAIVDLFEKRTIEEVLASSQGRYTDDTQMMIALAESLLDNNGVNQDALMQNFVSSFELGRGYGASVSLLIEYVKSGTHWEKARRQIFTEGSYGNGAAMRITGLPCYYYDESADVVWNKAIEASEITHAHAHGYIPAALLSLLIYELLHTETIDAAKLRQLIRLLNDKLENGSITLCNKMDWIKSNYTATKRNAEIIMNLGNNVLAEESVFSAIFIFLSSFDDPEKALKRAISIGGDTDTICAMTGSLLGAYHGMDIFPKAWLDLMENGEKGLDYILSLADRIAEKAAV
jgi:poly(ADP-ribose) glycohydrolase ARH3